MIFTIIHKDTGRIYTAYDVVQSKGYPHFLIYEDGQWVYRSAKHFRPLKLSRSKFEKWAEDPENSV